MVKWWSLIIYILLVTHFTTHNSINHLFMLRFIFDCFVCFIASLEYHRHRNDLKWMVILNNVYTRPPHASCSHQGSHQADLSRFEQNPTSHHVSCPLYRILLPTYNIQHGYKKNTFNFNHGQDKVSVLCSFIFNTQLFCFFCWCYWFNLISYL